MIASKVSRMAIVRHPRHTILSTLLITLSCWAHLAFARLKCIPPDPVPNSVSPDQGITLRFEDDSLYPIGFRIKAFLICSSDLSRTPFGQNYGFENFRPNSPRASITVPQVNRALTRCSNNNFYVRYEYYSDFLSGQGVDCDYTFSLLVAPTTTVPVLPSTTSAYAASPTRSATSQPLPTSVATGTLSLSASHTLVIPSPSTRPGGTSNIGGGFYTPTDPMPSNIYSPEDLKDGNSTSPSIGLITGASVGVVALIFVILAVILVWRKRQQAQARIDHLFNDSLMASSGFQNDKPIYGRSDRDDDHSATHSPAAMDALVMPLNQEQYRNPRPRPGYTQINQPLPQLPHAAAQHQHYRQQQHQHQQQQQQQLQYQQQQQQQKQQHVGPYQEYDQEHFYKEELPQQQQHAGRHHDHDQEQFYKEELPPQRQPSYRLPYSQPANDYNYPRRHQGM